MVGVGEDLPSGESIVENHFLKGHADITTNLFSVSFDISAIDPSYAVGRRYQCREYGYHRGFSRSVWTKQRVGGACID